ncbi:TPA_asm: maturation protein [ssRNA phage Zoerhiza.2_7]|uniref:Maturation protein n=2 Tax=Fiersviridae TaxID=2842319 RepID=A0A8S5KY75_9VIRU|nr:maturation protein [ssRNA phage Zoerhiza.2_7]QDH87014.1 MAG: hypothetical protein H2Rhizo31550_000001 [Leviviridae sp.]DAD50132.1 TPA_asm: maturation protein [ssRNA phage Zoerhiza.2_7]
MVAPVTGPIVTTQEIPGGDYPMIQIYNKYKQKRPYKGQPLPYLNQRLQGKRWVDPEVAQWPQYTSPGNWNPWWVYAVSPDWYSGLGSLQSVMDYAIARARAKFIGKLGESAALGTTLAERKQSMDMIAARGLQVLDFCRKLRSGNIPGASKALGVSVGAPSRPKKGRDVLYDLYNPRTGKATNLRIRRGSNSFANNFLEFHFGWSPLLGDIYSAAQVLSSPIPRTRIVGTGRREGDAYFLANQFAGINWLEAKHNCKVVVRVQAEVSVSNPNLRLASQLGLINPAALAWELVPFSFVVDWFVNVSDFLNQFTELAGLDIVNPQWTYNWDDTCQTRMYNTQRFFLGGVHPQGDEWRCDSTAHSTRRQLGIPSVKLGMRAPWSLSPIRGITAISLLIQQGLGLSPSGGTAKKPTFKFSTSYRKVDWSMRQ